MAHGITKPLLRGNEMANSDKLHFIREICYRCLHTDEYPQHSKYDYIQCEECPVKDTQKEVEAKLDREGI